MDKFWDTKEGKILAHGIHEHNSGLGRIVNYVHFIKRSENLSPEKLNEYLDYVLEGRKKCQEAMDYVYEQIKLLNNEK